MAQSTSIKLFEDKNIRTLWDETQEQWYFSVVDVIAVLTDSDYQHARNYWKVLKNRLKSEGNETVTNCNQLKMVAPDGKMRETDVATAEQLLRLVQSIPSKKAEQRIRIKQNEMAAARRKQVHEITPIFMEKHCRKNNRANTYRSNEELMRLYIIPHLGDKYIADIDLRTVQDMYDNIKNTKTIAVAVDFSELV